MRTSAILLNIFSRLQENSFVASLLLVGDVTMLARINQDINGRS